MRGFLFLLRKRRVTCKWYMRHLRVDTKVDHRIIIIANLEDLLENNGNGLQVVKDAWVVYSIQLCDNTVSTNQQPLFQHAL